MPSEAQPTGGTPAGDRAQYIEGLRQIADWLERNPDIIVGANQRAKMGTIARAMGRAEKVVSEPLGLMRMVRRFAGIRLVASADRAEVCERIVTGTREVTKEVLDTDALAAVPKVTVTETVEDIEWVCGSLLGADAVAVAR